MEKQRLVQVTQESQKMIDYFLRDEFASLSSDESFFELFLRYFRTDIFENSLLSKRFFLKPSEKTLQYLKPQAVESVVEYELLVRTQATSIGKAHYAKKGAEFCVVLPVLHERRDRKLYERMASRFYRQAALFSEGELNRILFDFLGGVTKEMIVGLGRILANIRRDGQITLRKVYDELVQEYSAAPNTEEASALARLLVRFGRLLELPDDEIPVRGEHYRLLFIE